MPKFRKIYGIEPMHVHNHKNIYVPNFMSYSAMVSLSTIWVLWRLCHRQCKSLFKSHFSQLPDTEDRKYTLWNPRTFWIGEYIKYKYFCGWKKQCQYLRRVYWENRGSEQSPENVAGSGKHLCSVHCKTLQRRNMGKKGECRQKGFWEKKKPSFVFWV